MFISGIKNPALRGYKQFWQHTKLVLNMAYFVRFCKYYDVKLQERDSFLIFETDNKTSRSIRSTIETNIVQ